VAATDFTLNPTRIADQPDFGFLRWVSSKFLNEERPYVDVTRQFLRIEGPFNAPILDFPIQGDPGASSTYTEGTGTANTALTSTKASATAVSYGIMATVTDENQENALNSAIGQAAGVLGRSDAEEFEAIYTAFLDDFANTVGTAGVATTYSDILAANAGLAARDQAGGPIVGVLDPVQVGNVQQDMATTGAAMMGNPNVMINGQLATSLSGYSGVTVGNTPLYQTSLVTSSGGGVFLSGVALGCYEIRPSRLRMERHEEVPGTTIVVTSRHGGIEIRDRAGVTVIGS
jgi:hypothetical protein